MRGETEKLRDPPQSGSSVLRIYYMFPGETNQGIYRPKYNALSHGQSPSAHFCSVIQFILFFNALVQPLYIKMKKQGKLLNEYVTTDEKKWNKKPRFYKFRMRTDILQSTGTSFYVKVLLKLY